MPEPRRPLWRRLALPASIALAAVVPYLGVLDAPYVFDDVKLVKENRLLREAWGDWGRIAETFDITSHKWDQEELRPNYRPLRFLSYWIDARLSELIAGPIPESGPPVLLFHLTNLLLHAANSILVLVLARRLARSLYTDPDPERQRRAANFFGVSAALLFALHPIQTEAVTYISGRRDVLSAFFFLAAVAIHLRRPAGEAPGALGLIAVPILFVLGLLTKESVATLPGALILIDLVRRARWGFQRVALHLTAIVLAGIFVWITLSNPRLVSSGDGTPPGAVALTACRYVTRYLRLCILPVRQSIDYSFDAIPPATGLFSPASALLEGLLVLGLLGTASWSLLQVLRGAAMSSTRRLLALGPFWLVGTLLPVLQFAPIAEKFAERFAYVPALGVFLLAAALLTRLFIKESLAGIGVLALGGVAMFAATARRNGQWETPLALWTSAVEAQPRAARAHLGRANALKETGRLKEAAEEYTKALQIFEESPNVPLHHGFILQALTFRGGVDGLLADQEPALLDRAMGDYRRVLESKDVDGTTIDSSPKHVALHFDLAGLLLKKGDRDGSRKEYGRVVELVPALPLAGAAHYYLARINASAGDASAAEESYRRACEAIPRGDPQRLPVFIERIDLLIEHKSLDEASRVIHEALTSGAEGKLKLHLLMREAKVYDRKGDLNDCTATLERILAEDPAYGPALLTLGRIEASQSKHDRAEGRFQALLKLEPANPEALEGLQNVRLLRKIAEGKTGAQGTDSDPKALIEAMEKKGLEAIAKGEILAARDIFSKLLVRATEAKLVHSQTLALRGLARAEESIGHYKAAETHLKTSLELDALDTRALQQIGDLTLQRLGDRAAAQRYYEQCVASLPRGELADPLVHFNLAELIGASDPLVALSHLDRARKAGLDAPSLDRAYGYRHADAGHWKESLDAFNRYFERTPVFQAGEGEDLTRKAAKDFVREQVVPHAGE